MSIENYLTREELIRRYKAGERSFQKANLIGVNLSNINLSEINLTGASLQGANLSHTNLSAACLNEIYCGMPWLARILMTFAQILIGILSSAIISMYISRIALDIQARHMNGLPIQWLSEVCMFMFALILAARIGTRAPTAAKWAAVILVAQFFLNHLVILMELVSRPIAMVLLLINWRSFVEYLSLTVLMTFAANINVTFRTILVILPMFTVALGASIIFKTHGEGLNPNVFVSDWRIALAIAAPMLQLALICYVRRQIKREDSRHPWQQTFAVMLGCWRGTRFCHANLDGATFAGAMLRGADLRSTQLTGTRFRGCQDLGWALFDDGALRKLRVQRVLMTGLGDGVELDFLDLRGLYLQGVSLVGASLTEAALVDADLRGADLSNAVLSRADLRGAYLTRAKLDGAVLTKARIDALTYVRSGLSPDELVMLHERGVDLVALDAFPQTAQDRLLGEREGLSLAFSTLLSAFDRLIVEGVIVGVLGRETDCRVVEYREHAGTALIRMTAAKRADLERVAEALYRKIWESADERTTALLQLSGILSPSLRAGLGELRERISRMALRTLQHQPAMALNAPFAEADAIPVEQFLATRRWEWDLPLDQISSERPCRLVLLHSWQPTDCALAAELLNHLRQLQRQGLISVFHEGAILPGQDIDDVTRTELDSADLVLVLVSSDLLADETALSRVEAVRHRPPAASSRAVVVPVLLRPCVWEEALPAAVRPLPEEGWPVTQWPDRDAAWTSIVSSLRRLLLERA